MIYCFMSGLFQPSPPDARRFLFTIARAEQVSLRNQIVDGTKGRRFHSLPAVSDRWICTTEYDEVWISAITQMEP